MQGLAPGRLAQLVERLVYTENAGSSSLSPPTIFHLARRRPPNDRWSWWHRFEADRNLAPRYHPQIRQSQPDARRRPQDHPPRHLLLQPLAQEFASPLDAPWMKALLCHCPDCRVMGASPARDATCLRSSVPSSRHSISRVAAVTGPMPGVDVRMSSDLALCWPSRTLIATSMAFQIFCAVNGASPIRAAMACEVRCVAS